MNVYIREQGAADQPIGPWEGILVKSLTDTGIDLDWVQTGVGVGLGEAAQASGRAGQLAEIACQVEGSCFDRGCATIS